MKKISYYLIFIVVIGGVLVSFWSYQKYFKKEGPKFLFFQVERGNIQDIVKVRGEVVPENDFDLEFSFSGIVERVFVKEGEQIKQGVPLMKLDTTDFELEIQTLEAQLAQAEAGLATQKAKLAELKRGTRLEEIRVQEVKVANAKTALEDAKKNLVDKLQDAYTKSDDAVRNKVDQFFSNPRSQSPQLTFYPIDSQLETDLEGERMLIESILKSWRLSLDALGTNSDLASYLDTAKKNLNQTKSFLDKAALAVNGLTSHSTLSQSTIDTWKADVSTGRTNVNTALNNLTAADEKLKIAESNLKLEESNLALKKAGTIEEQILAQEAQAKQAEANIQSYQAKIAEVQEKIRKSTIYAPGAARVAKIWFERQEVFRPGQTAITLETSSHKIQADISELEIGKIREVDGNEVSVQLDAFPDLKLKGRVVSIEPREIIKEGDRYYRTNVYIEPHGSEIRSGMNADLVILISFKDNVLKIPEFAVYQKDDKEFVTVPEGDRQKEVEIETGISDGESVEVIKGLTEGQTIAVSAD